MKVRINILFPVFILLIFSCDQKTDTNARTQEKSPSILSAVFYPDKEVVERYNPLEYINFVENKENGFITEKAFSDLSFSVFAQPEEYVALKRLDPSLITEKGFKNELKDVAGYQYFMFSVRLPGKTDLLSYKTKADNEFHDRLQFYSFKFQDNVFLIDGQDTLSCKLSHFERNHGMSSVHNFLLVFEKREGKGEKTLIVEDPFLGLGKLKFHFEKKVFNSKTELIFS